MNIGKACRIFKNVEIADFTVEEKGLAIYQVMNMATHNSITKNELLIALKWLWNQHFEFEKDE